LILTVWFFERIPVEGTTLALDWIDIRKGVTHWDLTYGLDTGLRIPPWSALLLLPLGQISMNSGWGVVAFLTLIVLTLCVPREADSGRKWIAGVLALTLSFPALRTMVDGNVEFLILGGLVLLEYGLARKNPILFGLGILLTAAKVQETWILLVFLPLVAGKAWATRKGLATIGVLALVGIPTLLWKGRDWLISIITSQYRGSIMDSSLLTTVQRSGGSIGLALLLWAAVLGLTIFISLRYVRGYSREAVGYLTAASLLLAPYAAGNNVLIVYALGVVPLLLSRRWEGILLAALINLPYLLLPFRELNYWYSASYWTLVLVLAWILFALRLRELRRKANPELGAIDFHCRGTASGI
jgi:uncharacterized membrane protein